MISINPERCNGCGVCLEVCPNGALYLLEGKAVVDEALCRECEACVAACPQAAILSAELATTPPAEPVHLPALRPEGHGRPEPEVVRVETYPPLSWRARVLPGVGAALAWTTREIVPRLADYFLDHLDRRAVERQATGIAQHTSGTDLQTDRCGGGGDAGAELW